MSSLRAVMLQAKNTGGNACPANLDWRHLLPALPTVPLFPLWHAHTFEASSSKVKMLPRVKPKLKIVKINHLCMHKNYFPWVIMNQTKTKKKTQGNNYVQH